MVKITVEDTVTGQKMTLTMTEVNEDDVIAMVSFNPPREEDKKYPELWDIMTHKIIGIIKGSSVSRLDKAAGES